MNPGDVRPLGGRLMSAPYSHRVRIEPQVVVAGLKPGMLVRFGYHTGDEHRSTIRPGYAVIRRVDKGTGELTFELALSSLVPSVCEGDQVFEYETPCTRCECNRCRAERSPNESEERK